MAAVKLVVYRGVSATAISNEPAEQALLLCVFSPSGGKREADAERRTRVTHAPRPPRACLRSYGGERPKK